MTKKAQGLAEKQLTMNGRGIPVTSIRNCYLLLRGDVAWHGVLRFDEFSLLIEKLKAPPYERGELGEWSDADTHRTQVWLEQRYQVEFPQEKVMAAVAMIAADNGRHPVREYLTGLKWDGTPRCEHWLYMCMGVAAGRAYGPDSRTRRYAAKVGSMWLVSAVARVMKPGCKADHVLILEGPQGLGKSSALGILGGEWTLDTPIVLGDKDSYLQMQGRWIVEMPELDSLNKSDATQAKAFLSRGVDRFRPPYGRNTIAAMRQCVFAGTTNQSEYLKDPTGARRYWPVLCTWFERDLLEEWRDQLWAEALHLYHAGFAWWPHKDDRDLLSAEQALREAVDPWEEILARELSEPDRLAQQRFYAAELLNLLDIEPARQQERAMTTRVGAIMHRLGWTKVEASGRAERRIARFFYQRPPDDEQADGRG